MSLRFLTHDEGPADLGVTLANDADPADHAAAIQSATIVRLSFPKWTDGRAYSQARLIRQRLGYRGEVRAVGDVVVDMAPLLARCGFTSAVLRDGQDAQAAQKALSIVSVDFQPNYPAAGDAHIEHTVALLRAASRFERAALASSLSVEDQVLTHLIVQHQLSIDVFAIDTGRLPAETLATLEATERQVGVRIEVRHPNADAVAAYVTDHGANAFYESVELRKACCHIRKVEPLQRALAGRGAWVTGQRRAQASSRTTLAEREFDAANGLDKFNPLASWSTEQVWAYARAHGLPTNPLHERGYPSIGCEPCTRAVKPGEDIRAGRWWWEIKDAHTSECGLHSLNASVSNQSAAAEAETSKEPA